jgi:hypothetical protein
MDPAGIATGHSTAVGLGAAQTLLYTPACISDRGDEEIALTSEEAKHIGLRQTSLPGNVIGRRGRISLTRKHGESAGDDLLPTLAGRHSAWDHAGAGIARQVARHDVILAA